MSDNQIKQFQADRDAALLSLDETKIRAFAQKYEAPLPSDPDTFWTAVHKARTGAKSLPEFDRRISMSWLSDRGFKDFADDLS